MRLGQYHMHCRDTCMQCRSSSPQVLLHYSKWRRWSQDRTNSNLDNSKRSHWKSLCFKLLQGFTINTSLYTYQTKTQSAKCYDVEHIMATNVHVKVMLWIGWSTALAWPPTDHHIRGYSTLSLQWPGQCWQWCISAYRFHWHRLVKHPWSLGQGPYSHSQLAGSTTGCCLHQCRPHLQSD